MCNEHKIRNESGTQERARNDQIFAGIVRSWLCPKSKFYVERIIFVATDREVRGRLRGPRWLEVRDADRRVQPESHFPPSASVPGCIGRRPAPTRSRARV